MKINPCGLTPNDKSEGFVVADILPLNADTPGGLSVIKRIDVSHRIRKVLTFGGSPIYQVEEFGKDRGAEAKWRPKNSQRHLTAKAAVLSIITQLTDLPDNALADIMPTNEWELLPASERDLREEEWQVNDVYFDDLMEGRVDPLGMLKEELLEKVAFGQSIWIVNSTGKRINRLNHKSGYLVRDPIS